MREERLKPFWTGDFLTEDLDFHCRPLSLFPLCLVFQTSFSIPSLARVLGSSEEVSRKGLETLTHSAAIRPQPNRQNPRQQVKAETDR